MFLSQLIAGKGGLSMSQGDREGSPIKANNSLRESLTPAQKNMQLLRDLFLTMGTSGSESEEAMTNMLDENISWFAVPWNRTLLGREKVLDTVKHTWVTGVPSHPITHVFADDERV
jgi:hypothetical protein